MSTNFAGGGGATEGILAKAAKELDIVKALLSQFEQKRTVGQHEKLAFKIKVRLGWFEEHLEDYLKAVRSRNL